MLIILLLAFLQSLAQQEGWGPGDANSSSHRRATPVAGVHTEGLWAAKAISITLFADRFYRPHLLQRTQDTPPPHAEIPRYVGSRSGLTCLWQVRCSQLTREIHRSTEEPNASKSTKITTCAQTSGLHIPLPPSSSIQHCSQKLSSGTSRVSPWHSLYSRAFRNTCSVSCYVIHGLSDSRARCLKERQCPETLNMHRTK